MTVLEAIQRSTDFLGRKGIDSPRLQAELLLAHVLRLPRMRLYLEFERVLAEAEIDQLRGMVTRRGQREPLQHILGTANFCGLELTVNRHVLVPRPETELLAEMGWEFLSNRAQVRPGEPPSAVDFGTGTGCLAIALAVHCPKAKVLALDKSKEALAVAQANVEKHGVADRVELREGSSLAELEEDRRFALVISNPPYIPTSEIDSLQPEVRDFDPRMALDGGKDGLDLYRVLAREAPLRLVPDGRLMVEIGDAQQERIETVLREQNWVVENLRDDYTHRPRILTARR